MNEVKYSARGILPAAATAAISLVPCERAPGDARPMDMKIITFGLVDPRRLWDGAQPGTARPPRIESRPEMFVPPAPRRASKRVARLLDAVRLASNPRARDEARRAAEAAARAADFAARMRAWVTSPNDDPPPVIG